MGNFSRNRSGARSFGGNRGFNRDQRPTMHKAICSKCGRECEVPFRPTREKPVYCRDCFREINGGGRNEERNFSRPQNDNRHQENTVSKEEFANLSAKVDRILSILEKAIAPKEMPAEEEVVETIPPVKKKRAAK